MMKMKMVLCFVVGGMLLAGSSGVGAAERPDTDDLEAPIRLIILGSGKDYLALKREALAISRKTHVPFSNRGMIFDKKGLRFPDKDSDDPVWEGAYLYRREDTMEVRKGVESPFISIEKSDDYPGLKKGMYVIVGGICWSAKDAKTGVARYSKVVPDAYAPTTTIYVGCMH